MGCSELTQTMTASRATSVAVGGSSRRGSPTLAYIEKGEYDRALADGTRSIALDPDLELAFTVCGNAYYYKGQEDIAVAELTRAIELDPKQLDAVVARGFVHFNRGDYIAAILTMSRALRQACMARSKAKTPFTASSRRQ